MVTKRENRDRALFDTIAHKYCRKDLDPASRLARCCRLEQTLGCLAVGHDISLLEVGCGAGFSARYLKGRYGYYCGVDYSSKLIDYARRHNGGNNICFKNLNIREYCSPEAFDVILMIGVLHHLDDLQASVRHLMTMLKPGGRIVANEPHPGNRMVQLMRWIRKKVDDGYSGDQRELSANELRTLLGSSGFVDIRLVPQGFLSTPFAEVVMPWSKVVRPITAGTCVIDRLIEKQHGSLLRLLSWNLIAVGRKPGGGYRIRKDG